MRIWASLHSQTCFNLIQWRIDMPVEAERHIQEDEEFRDIRTKIWEKWIGDQYFAEWPGPILDEMYIHTWLNLK